MRKKNVVILGSTGSIDINTLKVIDRFPQAFNVVGLTAYSNYRLLEKQIQEFAPRYVAVNDAGCAYLKNTCVGRGLKILNAHTDLEAVASLKEVDLVVVAMQGSAALKPFLAAVRCGKTVAPANKEAIVIAGDILMDEARRHKARIVPIDSEQSAIFQCLDGRDRKELKKIYEENKGKYKVLKDILIEDLKNFIRPMRERREEIAKDLDFVNKVLTEGKEKARTAASQKMTEVRRVIGVRSE